MSPAQALRERGELTNRSWTTLVHCPHPLQGSRGTELSLLAPWPWGLGSWAQAAERAPALASWPENLERSSLKGAGAVGGNGQRWQLPSLGLHSGAGESGRPQRLTWARRESASSIPETLPSTAHPDGTATGLEGEVTGSQR